MEVSDLTQWNLVVGSLAPPFVAFIQQSNWSSQLKGAIMIAVSLALAAVTTSLETTIDWNNYTTSALTIAVAAIATYHRFWKPTEIAPSIQKATDIKKTT